MGTGPGSGRQRRVYLQSAAIVKHLAKKLGRFQGADPMTRQAVRECCTGTSMSCFHGSSTAMAFNSVSVGFYQIHVEPTIAYDHRRRAEMALSVLDSQLPDRNYLCGAEPTIADLFCYGDVAFAELCAFDLHRWTNVVGWTERVTALSDFKAPFALLAMESAELS